MKFFFILTETGDSEGKELGRAIMPGRFVQPYSVPGDIRNISA
jgi:hypothetical protein